MDLRTTWLQPEQLGPATTLWSEIFDSATDRLRNLQMADSNLNGGGRVTEPSNRVSVGKAQDFIPIDGDSVEVHHKRTATNGYAKYGERTSNQYKRRKDNLASTYDWNHSGKVRDGGTPWRTHLTGQPQHYAPGVIGYSLISHAIFNFGWIIIHFIFTYFVKRNISVYFCVMRMCIF